MPSRRCCWCCSSASSWLPTWSIERNPVPETAVEIMGVSKLFGDTRALEHIDFRVEDGEFVSLLGASGCGKSTLLRILAGFERPTTGTVQIYQQDVTQWPPEKRPTNLVFQRGALFPHMTVRENIGYSLKLRRWTPSRIDARIEEMLALVRLDGLGDRAPSQLSGGQAQRVALARALASEPRVLLLDEPLSALDLKLRQQMQLELRAIQKRLGATFVFVTHDQTEALVMSDRIAIMNNGRIVQYGTPRDIYRRPNSVFVSDFVGATNLLSGVVGSIDGERIVLQTASGAFAAPKGTEQLRKGERAVLSLRPEAVRLHPGTGRTAEGSSVSGNIAEIIFQGNCVRIGTQILPDATIWAELRDDEADGLTPGDPVTLSWAESAAAVMKEEPQ
ncbi:MAG: ABC transporter ATP-binding protein [Alphaproteobacteria bacterium]|nr:ABC transporter ATP-binding protein [Alphaproteobacteria bacterium]MBU0805025.1 ABC transporter ATP-binding protein [Alphaproteobacteria bacterium]MBU0870524.1 ABC transporter ATP-binding protein [Alphaproteobacteria bacterium]MBU1401801.1 ABC transporter ATP-binding protein [Alphaproteobacteria bacterium]MBU1591782.1 ABC transporter ATP-binding protein [Alphaproteobacteria bacterium]